MTRTYAVLGATGNAGRAVLNVLGSREDVNIRPFVRSKSKLEGLAPDICASSRVEIHEGSIDHAEVLQRCLSGVDAAFLLVSAGESTAGCRVSRDQAEAVVAALQKLRDQQPRAKLPMLIVFSSAEADDKFFYDTPFPIRNILYAANYFIYEDLKAAERYLRQYEWVDKVFLKSGGISYDQAQGHILSEEASQTFISWADVAAGMVQLADEGQRWSGKNVSVQSNAKAKPEYSNVPLLFRGLGVYARSFLPV